MLLLYTVSHKNCATATILLLLTVTTNVCRFAR